MSSSHSRRLCLLLLSLILLSSACSRVGFAYRNLDLLIPWALSDYLSLDPPQQQLFDTQLASLLRWHCQQELPRYNAWLATTEQLLEQREIDPAQLDAQVQQVRQAIDTLAQQQVQALGTALQEDIAEQRQKYLKPAREKQIAQRARRMEKRLSTWYGSLNREQKQQVRAWAEARDGQDSLWIDNRAQWQARLMATLEYRQSPEFEPRIAELLHNRQEQWTPAYQKTFASAEDDLRQLLLNVHRLSSREQRLGLRNRLSALRNDLAKVQCQT